MCLYLFWLKRQPALATKEPAKVIKIKSEQYLNIKFFEKKGIKESEKEN